VQVVDRDEHGCAGAAAAEADVMQPAVVPQGEFAVGVDLVVADPEVAIDQRNAAGGDLRAGGVGIGRGAAAKGAVRPDVVGVAAEPVELVLQGRNGQGSRLGGQLVRLGLVEALDLAAGLWVIGA
jgi:hypothetical protein